MPRTTRELITVSPPNLERTGFLALERGLARLGPPTRRDWLIDRFSEGWQVRMLRQPGRGFIEFAPGRASWLPIEDADSAVVVQCLRLDQDSGPPGAARTLMAAAEDWARYYGFAAVLALHGGGPCMLREPRDFGHGFAELDRSPCGVRLLGKVLQGPSQVPRLAGGWRLRGQALGPGLVVQTAGMSDEQDHLAEALFIRARRAGLRARIVRLATPQQARESVVSPLGLFSVLWDGQRVGDDRMDEAALWHEIAGLAGLS